MRENERQETSVSKIKKILELFLEMISGLKTVAENHEERIEQVETAVAIHNAGNLAMVEIAKDILETQDGHSDELAIHSGDINTLLAREKAHLTRITTLEDELRDLRALVLRQFQIDLDQGGVYFKGWYEERDRMRATVKEQASRSPE